MCCCSQWGPLFFFFSSRRRHTRWPRDWSSDVCSSDLHDLEPNKVLGAAIYKPTVVAVEGNYDDVNRLCTQIADQYKWGFANINLRSYYAEGAKTMGFEIVEQLG